VEESKIMFWLVFGITYIVGCIGIAVWGVWYYDFSTWDSVLCTAIYVIIPWWLGYMGGRESALDNR